MKACSEISLYCPNAGRNHRQIYVRTSIMDYVNFLVHFSRVYGLTVR